MPGTSIAEAMAVVAGEVPDWPFLPELPARGAGADMVGRTAAVLLDAAPDFALDTVPTGWRRSGVAGPEMRRARSWLGEDLDRLEQVLAGGTAPVKIQLCGPWTWAAVVEDGAGRRLMRDESFMTDLVAALGVAAADHVRAVERRLPDRQVVLQFDEPALPAVLAGDLPTVSGWGTLAAVPRADVIAALQRLTGACGAPSLMHCCGGRLFDVVRAAGFRGASWDATGALDATVGDELAETVEAGVAALPGVVGVAGDVDAAWAAVRQLWARTGLGVAAAHRLSVTPGCGLASVSMAQARVVLAACTSVQRRVAEWE